MQHLWIHHRQHDCSFNTYQDLVERVKLTPRKWNSRTNINDTLKQLTWILGTSINLIAFKRKRINYECPHTRHCYFPIYQFHNPYIKLNKQSDFFQMNILEFKSQYYSIPSDSCHPILINKKSDFNFDILSKNDIHQILQGKHLQKPFMVALYSTPSFVRTQYTNIINQNIIGILQNNSTQVLHLFITPHLNSTDFDVCHLETLNLLDYNSFNKINHLSCRRPTEGDTQFKNSDETNKNILNQDYCVCEHPDTERYFAPTNHCFKSLGKLLNKNKIRCIHCSPRHKIKI